MSALHPWATSSTTAPSSVGSAAPSMWDTKRSTGRVLSVRGCSDGNALTSTTPSSTGSSPAAADIPHVHRADDNNDNINSISSMHEEGDVQQQQQQQRWVRQWTPRRRSPASTSARSGSEGTVPTVRDWVRSAGCSPSKQPRSATSSHRDDLVLSFAAARVPRDEQGTREDIAEEEGGEEGEARKVLADDVARYRNGSPQRTASWRQLRSHPGGASSRQPSPQPSAASSVSAPFSLPGTPSLSRCGSWTSTHVSTNCGLRGREEAVMAGASSLISITSPAATALHEGTVSADREGGVSPPLSGVSSPSVRTPLSSRCPSPAVFAAHHISSSSSSHDGSNGATRRLPPPSSLLEMRAREAAQMREWQGEITHLHHQQQQQQQHLEQLEQWGGTNDENAQLWHRAAAAERPPTVPHSAHRDDGAWAQSARSASVSRASFASAVWSDQPGSTAATSLGWQQRESNSREGEWRPTPLSSRGFSSRSVSPVSLCCGGSEGRARRGSAVSALSSPSFSSFPFHPSSAEALSLLRVHGDGYSSDTGGGGGGVGDARTMEDIEDANTKRQCVESPTTSPQLASLSFSLGSSSSSPSLAEALAAHPLRMALPSEAHLWEQRERRRRGTSPSLARTDEDENAYTENDVTATPNLPLHSSCGGRDGVVREGSVVSAVLSPRGDAAGRPDCSPLVSAARSSAAAAASRRPDLTTSPSLAPVREATVAPSRAAALRTGVVEVGDGESEEEEGEDAVGGRAASLSFCSASEDEPEVDTFALERAQAVMEDADAEVVGAILARQHQLHVEATSDFALDLRAHGGGGADASSPWASDRESTLKVEGERAWKRTSAFSLCPTPPAAPSALHAAMSRSAMEEEDEEGPHRLLQHGMAYGTVETTSDTSTCSPMSPPPTSPSPAPATLPPAFADESSSTRGASSATAAPTSPATVGRISGDERTSFTPPRPKRPTTAPQHVRWGLPEEEEVRSPGSATTSSSHSQRDVSPPVRERSLAPAELWKEKAEV